MATTLQQPIVAVDLRGVVDSAIQNAQAVRRMRAIEIETEFQKQVAEGLPYDSQIAFLTNQLEKEKTASLSSKEIVAELEKRITDTKRLKRFNTYRTNYQNILTELKAGRTNSKDQLIQMKALLNSAGDDPELRLEIERDITAMEAEVKAMEDTMVQNQLKRAQYDGTEKILNEALLMVKGKRSEALFAGLDDEASAYDTWITVLNKQLNETKIVNSMNDIDVRVNTKGLNAKGKVDELNQLIRSADGSTSITINNVTYGSAKEYWTNTRDAYLAGTGSGLFSDFFREIDNEYKENINAAIRRDGLVTTVVLDRVKSDFDDLKNRTEFKPFLERVQNYESLINGSAIESTAGAIIDRVSITGDYAGADRALQSYATKYGISVDSYRLSLSAQAEQKAISLFEASNGTISLEQARQKLGVSNILTPEDPGFKTPDAATVPEAERSMEGETSRFAGAAGYAGTSVVDFLRAAGQDSSFATRQALAAERGIQNYTGSAQQNIQLLNALKTEAVTPPKPAEKPAPTPSKIEAPVATKGATVPEKTTVATPTTAPKTNTPTPVAQPKTPTPQQTAVQPTPAATYQGASIVDYLSLSGQDSSYSYRAKIAAEKGITNYTGSAAQNTALLKALRGF